MTKVLMLASMFLDTTDDADFIVSIVNKSKKTISIPAEDKDLLREQLNNVKFEKVI